VLQMLTDEQKQQQQFLFAKIWLWSPTLLTRLIWHPVIASCFRELNLTYGIVVSRTSWHSGVADRPTRDSKKSVSSVLPTVAETLDPLHKLGRGITRTLKGTTMANSRISTYSYRLSPRKFWKRPLMFLNIFYKPS
jgi:hypothetical protein